MSTALYIVQAGMCCAVGHHAAAARCAMRAGMSHFRETQFKDDSGQPLLGAMLYGLEVWGERRLQVMLQSVLSECLSGLSDSQRATTAVVLLSAEAPRAQRMNEPMLEMLAEAMQRFGLSEHCVVMPAGKAGITAALSFARTLLSRPEAVERVVVAGVDCLLDAATIEELLGQERLASTEHPEGFIAGEAAGAVCLSFEPPPEGGVSIIGVGAGIEPAPVTGDEPTMAHGLTLAMRAAVQDAQCAFTQLQFHVSGCHGESWYFKEAALAVSRCLTQRVASFPHWAMGAWVGEVGAACGALTLAWLAEAMSRPDGIGRRGLAHFGNDDGARAALVLRYEGEFRT